MRARGVALGLLPAAALLALSVASAPVTSAAPPASPTATESAPGRLEALVVAVVDGDTIRVRLGDHVERVRYIGVNAPELHHPRKGEEPGGREAAAANRGLVAGRRVALELDIRIRDRYGRLLAYVWCDGLMVNAELVRQGYAQVMTVPPNVRYQSLFLDLERDARRAGRGLWVDAQRGVSNAGH